MKIRWDYKHVDELHNLRAECNIMAQQLRNITPLRAGRVPIRKLTNKVIDGTISYQELCMWHKVAKQLTA